nr:hypothetical protein CJLB15_00096 [Campylobacter phage CJLB-15]
MVISLYLRYLEVGIKSNLKQIRLGSLEELSKYGMVSFCHLHPEVSRIIWYQSRELVTINRKSLSKRGSKQKYYTIMVLI